MPQPLKPVRCENCNSNRRVILHRKQMASGAFHFCWMCSVCNFIHKVEGRTWVAKWKVEKHFTAEEISNLPILPSEYQVSCVKCGAPVAQYHHWAPKGIFGLEEAEQWPGDYLCIPCHERWHLKVTPQLVKEVA